MNTNKYIYYKIIQGFYGDKWEDLEWHETNATFQPKDFRMFNTKRKAYMIESSVPIKIINRRELNTIHREIKDF